MNAQATARIFDLLNRELTGRAVAWSSSNDALARVNAAGVVTAVSRGATAIQITATSEGKSGSVSVTTRGVIAVTVSPQTASPRPGSGLQLTATVDVDAGSGVSTAVSWTSRNGSVVSTNSTGLLVALAAGQAYVVATSQSDATKRDSALITVPDACAAIAHTLGTTVNGQLTSLACNGTTDKYEFSVAATTFYVVRFQPATNQDLFPLLPDVSASFPTNAGGLTNAFGLVRAGKYQIMIIARGATSLGAYSFTTQVNPLGACPIVFTTLGVTRAFSLTNCAAYTPQGLVGAFTAEAFYLNVDANQQLRFTVQSNAFQARLELFEPNTGAFPATASAAAVGGSAVLVYRPPVPRVVVVYVTSQTPGGAGGYTMTIDP
jgi:hypothetical protein